MARKLILTCASAMLVMLVVAGCGSDVVKDPYAEVSMEQAFYGNPPVISKGYKYKIVMPEVIESSGHLLLVRQGNITEFIVGRSIAEKIEGMDSANLTFNCVKKYSPFTHLKCEQVVSGVDTVFITTSGAIYYPTISDAETFKSKDHDEITMNRFRYNDTAGLRKMEEKKFSVAAQLARVEEDGEEVWMLTGPRASLRVDNVNDHMEIVLRQLLASSMDFEGGITYVETEDWPDRRDSHIAGTVEIDYVKFIDKVFSG